MELLGGNPRPPVEGQEPRSGRSNYFIGNDPAKWHADYSDLWPSKIRQCLARHRTSPITAKSGSSNTISSSRRTRTRTAIKLGFKGARKMRVDRNGDLVLQLAGGELRTHKPVAYQEIDGAKSIVTASYVVKSRNKVGIRVGGGLTILRSRCGDRSDRGLFDLSRGRR